MSTSTHDYFRKPPDADREVEHLVGFLLKETGGTSEHAQSDGSNGVCVVTHVERRVEPVIQNGPMCGLVALTMAAAALSSSPASDEVHPERLLQLAKEHGFSKNGEIFDVQFLKEIAKECLHCRTTDVVNLESVDIVSTILQRGQCLIVPYDADKDHTPCLEQGHKAHWCLLVGLAIALPSGAKDKCSDIFKCCRPNPSLPGHFVIREDQVSTFLSCTQSLLHVATPIELYVFARHGKSSHLGLWKYSDLLESNGNLVEVDPKRTRPGEYVIPEGGIKEGLCGKAILLSS